MNEIQDWSKIMRATKVQEYNPNYIPDHDESVYRSIELTAERVAEKYQCAVCPYVDGCKEGLWCYKDYLQSRARNKRSQGTQAKPPKEYDYYFKGERV